MSQKVWVVCAEIHEFYPGNDCIKINKDTTIEIHKKYKEFTHKRVLGVFTLSEGDNPHINNAMQQYRERYAAEGYLVSLDDIDNMNPDKPKKYVTFSGGSYELQENQEDVSNKGILYYPQVEGITPTVIKENRK